MILAKVKYGSWLYGTNTSKSDLDYYEISLPNFRQLLLNRETSTTRVRYDIDGKVLNDKQPITPGGNETTIVPIHKFVHDYLTGQAYAIELAYAIKNKSICVEHIDYQFEKFITDLIKCATTSNVGGMIGFALKQTMDYVHRAERMKTIQDILQTFKLDKFKSLQHERLSHIIDNKSVMHYLSEHFGLEIVDRSNNNKPYKALMFNGREYSEYTEVEHFVKILKTAYNKFGSRVANALEEQIDYKSLMHAYRVYEQIIELFETGNISFPRNNAKELLQIKQGLVNYEDLKQKYKEFDIICNQYISENKLPKLTSAIQNEVDSLLCDFLALKFML